MREDEHRCWGSARTSPLATGDVRVTGPRAIARASASGAILEHQIVDGCHFVSAYLACVSRRACDGLPEERRAWADSGCWNAAKQPLKVSSAIATACATCCASNLVRDVTACKTQCADDNVQNRDEVAACVTDLDSAVPKCELDVDCVTRERLGLSK